MRAFIAFELPPEVIRLAADLQGCLRRQGLKLRWVRPENIHLTVRFLGDISPEQSADVARAMQKTAALESTAIRLSAQGMGLFPGLRKPRVLWMGLAGQTDLLVRAAARLEEALAAVGIAREERAFKAHLTLARIQTAPDTALLQGAIETCRTFAPQPFEAAEMILFKSDLRPQGPVYTPLARGALGT